MSGAISIAGMDCKVGCLANIRAFFAALARGEPMPMGDPLALNDRDRRSLEEYTENCGIDLKGLSEIQRQLLLLIFGCGKKTPARARSSAGRP